MVPSLHIELNCSYIDLLSDDSEDDKMRVNKMILTQAVMLTMPGVPGIYFHSLVGSRNYYKGVLESGINRRINREKLSMIDLAKDLDDPENLRYKIYTAFKQLLTIRTKEKAFYPFGNADYPTVDSNRIFSIKRYYQNETIYAIYNFSNTLVQINALAPKVYDLLNEYEVIEKYWKIEPYNFYWFKEK